jgi:hypothetical protein
LSLSSWQATHRRTPGIASRRGSKDSQLR